jgi:GH18 family chitinase
MKNVYTRIVCVIAVVLLSSVAALSQFKVVGYFPSWAGNVSDIQFSKLTHINYAFVLPTATGGLQAIENPSKLQSLVSSSHANGVKILIAVGGWNDGNDSGFESLAANATYRTNFVNNLINFVNQYSLDGVDIDWEYPDGGASSNNYSSLMQQLSTALHNNGKLLTAAVVATGGSSIQSNVFGYVDFLNLMAYDGGGSNHSTYDYALQSLNYWKGRGLPSAKAILGVPFYGRSSSEYVAYNTLLNRGASANADSFQGIGYNGIPTIKSKTNLAFDQGGGIMIWELSHDVTNSNSLLTAIDQVVDQRNGGNPPGNTAPIGQTITLRGFNNLFVSSENGTAPMWCNRTTAQAWEQFTVVDAGGGKVALRSMSKYISSENGAAPITCNRTTVGDWEKFDWVLTADGKVGFRGNNGLFISSENGANAMTCTRTSLGGWEAFSFVSVSGARIAAPETKDIPEELALGKDGIVLYPNPSTAVINIEVAKPSQVVIRDFNSGRIVYTGSIATTIQVNNLPPGLYTATITDHEQSRVKKIVIKP